MDPLEYVALRYQHRLIANPSLVVSSTVAYTAADMAGSAILAVYRGFR